MAMGVAIETKVNALLAGYVNGISSALCVSLVPIALTGITIYILVMGWAIARGEAQDSFNTFVKNAIKISLVTGLAIGGGAAYQTVVVEGIQAIQGMFTGAFGGGATIGAQLDNLSAPYDALEAAYMSRAMSAGTFIPDVTLIGAAVLITFAQFALFIVGIGLYLISKIALALVLAIGPVFVLCAMWPATQKFTEAWLGQALNYVLLSVLIGATIAMLNSMAIQAATDLQANIDTANALLDAGALLLLSGGLVVVQLGLATIASALGGGAAISGAGRSIASYFLHRGGGRGSSGGSAAGGSISQSNAGGKLASAVAAAPYRAGRATGMAQRYVLDHLRRASTN